MHIGILKITKYNNDMFYEQIIDKLNASGNETQRIFGEDNNKIVRCDSTIFNKAFEILKKDCDSLLISIDDWRDLCFIRNSKIQLTNKVVLFCLKDVDNKDSKEFFEELKSIEKYWNIHIWVKKDVTASNAVPFIYHCGELSINEIIAILINCRKNKRKYVGYKHNLNELRQKIKFNLDLILYIMKQKIKPKEKKYDDSKSIPKLIHYCWFGGKDIPKELKKCMESWEIMFPDYQIKRWDENNFPFEKYKFAQEALAKEKWAFIADVARLHALYTEGGIYLDTDVEVLRSFDDLLDFEGFSGFESLNLIAMATIGFKPFHPWVRIMLGWYDEIHCDEDYTEIANTKVVSKLTKLYYNLKLDGEMLDIPNGFRVFPRDYFSPEEKNRKWNVTKNTYCIHHFTGLW